MDVPPKYRDKPSPGPWKWVPFVNWDGGLQDAEGGWVIANDETDNTPENPRDAALIAAAPAMLAMLTELEWACRTETDDGVMNECPSCQRLSYEGHAHDCRLGALLLELRK